MDDLITGCDTVAEAVELNRCIQSGLLSAKFPLRKYCSNSEEFLKSMNPKLIEHNTSKTFEPETVKVLGIRWTTQNDKLSVSLNLDVLPNQITKRILLSKIASVFDTLGLLSPVTIKSKLLMQKVWKIKSGWDDVIPLPLEKEFRSYYADLQKLDVVSVARHFSSLTSNQTFELIGCCDASDVAYCAVLYLRVPINRDKFVVSFVCSKTRVAPLRKPLSIPRLELQAASLLAKLIVKVELILLENQVTKYAFSDSTTVLSWLDKSPEHWKPFVANRVREIQKVVPPENWHYIRSRENPADLATRGVTVAKMLANPLWIEGPQILGGNLPSKSEVHPNEEALVELKKPKTHAVTCIRPSLLFIENTSSYNRLIKIVSFVLRFLRRIRPYQIEPSAEECNSALKTIIRTVQRHYYSAEYDAKWNLNVKKRSCLLPLSVFLDADGIIRVGGRLRNSKLPFNQRHPIILPANSHLVELYVRYLHEHYFHATKAFVVNFINSHYWIIGNLKRVVKKMIFQCVVCRGYRSSISQQIMGQLPLERVSEADAFNHSGVDFAGPFECKCTGHRSTKTSKIYLAVFVCLSSRAVHLELVSSLTTASFLDALRRFIAR